MSRLPTPGADNGTWGTILNDYLSTSHNSDGTLKAGSVGASQVQDGALPKTKLDTTTQASLTKADGSLQASNNLSDVTAGTARTNLGLGTAATMTPATLAADSAFSGTYVPRLAGSSAWAASLPYFNVKDYGAVGDNATNDTAAINAAIQAAAAVVQNPGGINAVGAFVEIPTGTYRADIVLANGVRVSGMGNGTVLRPWTTNGPGVVVPNSMSHGGLERCYLYGYGPSSRVTPYSNNNSGSGASNQAGQTYIQFLTLSTALISNVPVTSIVVNSVANAATIPSGATLTIGVDGGTVNQATVAAATTLSTVGTTVIPVSSYTPSTNYVSSTRIQATGGFADGLYFPMGRGSQAAGTTSGTYKCTWRDLRIANFGNHGVHIEGGTEYQCHQWSMFENIHCEYNRDSGFYLFGFIQNNTFEHCTAVTNGWNGWAAVAYLDAGTAWKLPNDNTFIRCIHEGAGNYNNAGTIVGVDAPCHGLYTEGANNTYLACWWEGNGLTDHTHASCGVYLNYVPTGNAKNAFLGCHFDNHFQDVYAFQGIKNTFDDSVFLYDGVTPASKLAYIRLDTSAIIGARNRYGAGAQIIYYGGSLSATPPMIQNESNGTLVIGAVSGVGFKNLTAVSGSLITFDGLPLAWATDNTQDIGMSGKRPRDVYAGRNLNLAGATITYGIAAPVSGTYAQGSIVYNSSAATGFPMGWMCTLAGTPGTWVSMPNL